MDDSMEDCAVIEVVDGDEPIGTITVGPREDGWTDVVSRSGAVAPGHAGDILDEIRGGAWRGVLQCGLIWEVVQVGTRYFSSEAAIRFGFR